jgi:hypothetical protein
MNALVTPVHVTLVIVPLQSPLGASRSASSPVDCVTVTVVVIGVCTNVALLIMPAAAM